MRRPWSPWPSACRPAKPPGPPSRSRQGAFGDLAGRVELTAARVVLTPALVARQVRAIVRFARSEITIEDVDGELGGGRFVAKLVLGRANGGLGARGRLEVRAADAAALIAGDPRPVLGRGTLRVEVRGRRTEPRRVHRGAGRQGGDHSRKRADRGPRCQGVRESHRSGRSWASGRRPYPQPRGHRARRRPSQPAARRRHDRHFQWTRSHQLGSTCGAGGSGDFGRSRSRQWRARFAACAHRSAKAAVGFAPHRLCAAQGSRWRRQGAPWISPR